MALEPLYRIYIIFKKTRLFFCSLSIRSTDQLFNRVYFRLARQLCSSTSLVFNDAFSQHISGKGSSHIAFMLYHRC